ncbi:MAG: 2,4-dienoyl-CoA reductase-like NADH-dependent reductase (Old Yellow Enzyme family), partial [Cognaticolwellia sp.]
MHTPITLPCGLTLPNRAALAPLTNLQSQPDGCLGEDELRWLTRRARGGFGLISTCAAFVSKQGHAWPGQLGIAGPEHLPGLTRLAQALTPHGP